MDFSQWTPEYFTSNSDKCLDILKTYNEWDKIPFLNHANLSELRDTCLVRFRGMVQDMNNSEIYLQEYDVLDANGTSKRVQNGKYRDMLHVQVSRLFAFTLNFE